MKVVAYSSNDPVLSEAEMALCVIARQTRVTSADWFGPSVVSPERTPKLGYAHGRPSVSACFGETL
jgi:hypothetical protein